jgi:hypothetical protein
LLNKKADSYLNTFFPKNKILERFKKFYNSKTDMVQVEKKDFKANLPVSTLSLIDKSCQPYFQKPEPPKEKKYVTFFVDGEVQKVLEE